MTATTRTTGGCAGPSPSGETFTLDLLYGDSEGGQRTVTRFGMIPLHVDDTTKWYPSTARHWNLDRPDPR